MLYTLYLSFRQPWFLLRLCSVSGRLMCVRRPVVSTVGPCFGSKNRSVCGYCLSPGALALLSPGVVGYQQSSNTGMTILTHHSTGRVSTAITASGLRLFIMFMSYCHHVMELLPALCSTVNVCCRAGSRQVWPRLLPCGLSCS